MGALSYLARRFVAGETSIQALQAAKKLNEDQLRVSLDLLGEDVKSRGEAIMGANAYCELLEGIADRGILSNVSLKLTQMGLDISEEFCLEQVTRVVAKAAELGNFVRLDMEGSRYTQVTLDLYEHLFKRFGPSVGLVIQAYLHRSEADVRRLAEMKAPVRVCKGAYKESSAIAFQRMEDIRSNYRHLVDILVKGGSRVGIATHDDQLIDWALAYTRDHKVSSEQYEFQMLYGLRRNRAQTLAHAGHGVRIYVPFGTHWFPYFSRRLRERKENIFFVLKSLVAD